jgi:glycosyltransferase involved in cell wall biosynthesis
MNRSVSVRSGSLARRFVHFEGLFFDDFGPDTAWIREQGLLMVPALQDCGALVLRGEFRPDPAAGPLEHSCPGLDVFVGGIRVAGVARVTPGPWEIRMALPRGLPAQGVTVALRLKGVGLTNALAWLGRVTKFGLLRRFRRQRKNRQMRISTLSLEDGAAIFDFSSRMAPLSSEFSRRHAHPGLNIVGFLTADLGVGESSRAMVRAADAAGIPSALVPLKLNCLNRLGDQTYAARLQETNPHPVNVFHIDPPAAGDIEHHHGARFRTGKYNVGYVAWELPEFPDPWLPFCDTFDEIWCPSDFTREAIAIKFPGPVLTMPHAIAFPRPAASKTELRVAFGLPAAAFLFLSLFDLNSYAARKNPQAAIEAFRLSGLGREGAKLVVKVHNAGGNPGDYAALQALAGEIPGVTLISETFSREQVSALQAACDCFVSLHRAEGFGLAIAECMYLGMPVISTDWSAPAEFVHSGNGCPVRAATLVLERSHGPYAKGATWADPDVGHASEWMRRLHGDRALAEQLGGEARKTVESRFSPAVIGARYRRRLESIATF